MPTGNPFTSAQAPQMLMGSPYTEEQNQIARQQMIADLLRKQSLEPVGDTQMVGGWAVQRSPLEGAAKLAQALGANWTQNAADEKNKALGERYKTDLASTLRSAQDAMTGTPSATVDDESGGHVTPAKAGSTAGYYQALMGHPATMAMGMQGMQTDMQAKRMAQMLLGGSPQAGAEQGAQAQGAGQPSQTQAGFTAHGVPMDMANAALAQDPSGKTYMDIVQKLREPKMSQDGKVLTYQNTGGQWGYAPAPGSVAAQKAFGQASEDVKNANELIDVPQSDGTTVKMTRAQALQRLQPQQPPNMSNVKSNFVGNRAETQKLIDLIPDPKERATAQAALERDGVKLGVTQSPAAKAGAEVEAKAEAEKKVGAPQAVFKVQQAVGTIDNALKQVGYMKTHRGLGNITGSIMSQIPNVSDVAANAQADLDTLKSQIGVQVLNAMREASKTGGAVGSVTEKEWPILQNQLGSLQQSQSTTQFKKRLEDVEATLGRVKASYLQEYKGNYPKSENPIQSGGQIDDLLNKYGG